MNGPAILDTSIFVAIEQGRPLARSELHAGLKPGIHDTWIAATALTHGGEVWTQDKNFTSFGAVHIVRM